MKFRTEVDINPAEVRINLEDSIFSMGSCFASEISTLLSHGQLKTLNNPFGTIFNPYSINTALRKIHDSQFYAEEDLISFDHQFISLDHHTEFNSAYVHKTLDKINSSLEEANLFLQHCKYVIITYGTSYIYEFLPNKKLVANCHKIPGKYFEKRLLTHLEITDAIYETITNIQDICPEGVQILFSVSPVRHTKDGLISNMQSKAKLITALHEILENFDLCTYLPIYEIMMDDLRDYRFYKEDMIHPNSQAITYIFEKFGNAYFSEETTTFIKENFKILQSLNHRPSDEKNPKYLEFRAKLNLMISEQQKKVKHKIFH